MKYNSIFWLDDNPDCVARVLDDFGQGWQELLKRITFAFDEEQGASITRAKSCDLHILDADFPLRMTPERREYVKGYVERLYTHRNEPFEYKACAEGSDNRFLRFHQKFVGAKRTIVYSGSADAPVWAWSRRLPFFFKGATTEDELVRLVETWHDGDVTPPKPGEWVCGGTKELVAYLRQA